MPRAPLNYSSKESALVIGRILDALVNGPVDTKQLIAATGRSGPRARGYIRHLEEAGRIYCLAPAEFIIGASKAALWALNVADPVQLESLDEVDPVDYFPQRVVVRTSWAPNHVRMPMDCLLFGVPVALQGVAA